MPSHGPMMHSGPFAVAMVELRRGLEAVGAEVPGGMKVIEALTRRTLRAYISAQPRPPEGFNQKRVLPETRDLAAMAIGETREFPFAIRQIYHQRMRTARNLLGDPEARWRVQTRGERVWIKRLRPGEKVGYVEISNVRAIFLADMLREDGWRDASHVFKDRQSLSTNTKRRARAILQGEDAEWIGKTTLKGIAIRRTR